MKKHVFIICISILIACAKNNVENESKSMLNYDIAKTVDIIIQAIKSEDIDTLVLLLYDGNIEYRLTKFKSKDAVISDIRNKKWIYNYLFDTNKLCYNRSLDVCDERSAKDHLMNSTNIHIIKTELIDSNKTIIRCTMMWDEIEKLLKGGSHIETFDGITKIDLIQVAGRYYLYSLAFQLFEIDEE